MSLEPPAEIWPEASIEKPLGFYEVADFVQLNWVVQQFVGRNSK